MKEFVAYVLLVAFMTIVCYVMHEKGMSDAYEEMKQYPSAMDVYQGKTTLQYTIIDDQKIDSAVIFKN